MADHPAPAGRVRGCLPEQGGSRPEERQVQGRDHPDHHQDPQGRRGRRCRRVPPARDDVRPRLQAQARVREGRTVDGRHPPPPPPPPPPPCPPPAPPHPQ